MSRIECSLARGAGMRRRHPRPLAPPAVWLISVGLPYAGIGLMLAVYAYGYGGLALRLASIFMGDR